MANKYYSAYFKRLLTKHDPLVQLALDEMIDAGVKEFEASGTILKLPTKGMIDALTELHLDAGVRWGVYTAKDIDGKAKKFKSYKPAYEKKSVSVENYLLFMREYLNRHLMEKSVIPIEDTQRKIMLNIINQGISEGDGVNKIAGKLKDLKLGKARSRLIVRTETGRAMNTGAMFAAAQSNLVVNKMWDSAQNNRTRRIPRNKTDHLRMNGVTVGYNDFFFVPNMNGIDAMQYPCDSSGSPENVCNCRCGVSFVPTGETVSANLQNEFISIISFVENNLSLSTINMAING